MFPPGFGEVAERLRRSTVHVSSGGRGHGSGIIVKSDGTIVTNAHVAQFGRLGVTLWDGRSFPAEVASRDLRRDLALLRLPVSDLPAAPLGDSNALRVGQLVIAVGNPLGFMGALTAGVVHAVGPLPGLGPRKWIQAGVRLAPGNSGGPLADASGNVIGVNSMVAGQLGLAVPSNEVTRLLRGHQPYPLGVVLRPVRLAAHSSRESARRERHAFRESSLSRGSEEWQELRGVNSLRESHGDQELSRVNKDRFGLMILELAPDGAASRASLLPGDILVGAGGRPFGALEDLEDALEGEAERVVRLQFVRGDPSKVRSVAVRLGTSNAVAA